MDIIPDSFGCCVVCHKSMLIEEVIGGKVEKRFTHEYVEGEFLLDDGSKMRVAMCLDCKGKYSGTDKEKSYIMDCVKAGWKKEPPNMKDWSAEKTKAYNEKYDNLNIVSSSEDCSKDALEKRFKEHKEKKNESHH